MGGYSTMDELMTDRERSGFCINYNKIKPVSLFIAIQSSKIIAIMKWKTPSQSELTPYEI